MASMVASSSVTNTLDRDHQPSVLVRSSSSRSAKLTRRPSATSGSPRPAGPRVKNPPSTFLRLLEPPAKPQVLAPPPSKAARRFGSVVGRSKADNPSVESFTSTDSSYSFIENPFPKAWRTPSPTHSRTSSESLPDFRSFSANRKRKTDAPAPLVLGRSNGSSHHAHADSQPNFLAIPPAHSGRSRRPSPPKPAASPSAATALAPGSRDRGANVTTTSRSQQQETQTSERLRKISKTLAPAAAPDPGLAGLYPPDDVRRGSVSNGDGIPTPLTPSFRLRAPQMPELRRQKIQKLARTLGENVPPSLVFPDWGNEKFLRPERSPSLSGSGRQSPRTPVSPALAAKLAADLTSTSSSSKAQRYSRRRSASVGNLFALDLNVGGLEEVRGKNAKGVSRWKAPSEWDGPSGSPPPSMAIPLTKQVSMPQPQPQPQTHLFKEEGQQGEWDSSNYDYVMDKLRNL